MGLQGGKLASIRPGVRRLHVALGGVQKLHHVRAVKQVESVLTA